MIIFLIILVVALLLMLFIYGIIIFEEYKKYEARLKLMSDSIYNDFEKIVHLNGKGQKLPENKGVFFKNKHKIDYSNLSLFKPLIDKRLQKQNPEYAAIVANIYIKIGPILMLYKIYHTFCIIFSVLFIALLSLLKLR